MVKMYLKRIVRWITSLIIYEELIKENSAYHARNELANLKSNLSSSRLEVFGYKVYSQNDEDGILGEIFRRLNVQSGNFCEIGVSNGLECNSFNLLIQGWKGKWIEGSSRHVKFINHKFQSLINNKRLIIDHAFVSRDNINSLIQCENFMLIVSHDNFHFLSIDIDGMDYYLLEGLELRPWVVCTEYNSKFPSHVELTPVYQPNNRWKGTDYMGSSLLSIKLLMESKGYSLVGTNITGANAFFVRDDKLTAEFKDVNDVTVLYNPPRYYLIDHFDRIGHRSDFGDYINLL
jgi:hypothetical protein